MKSRADPTTKRKKIMKKKKMTSGMLAVIFIGGTYVIFHFVMGLLNYFGIWNA